MFKKVVNDPPFRLGNLQAPNNSSVTLPGSINIQIEYIANISSERSLKLGEYWEISEKDLLKPCQKLENSFKTVV